MAGKNLLPLLALGGLGFWALRSGALGGGGGAASGEGGPGAAGAGFGVDLASIFGQGFNLGLGFGSLGQFPNLSGSTNGGIPGVTGPTAQQLIGGEPTGGGIFDAAKTEFRSAPIFTTAVAGGAAAAGLGALARGGSTARFAAVTPRGASATSFGQAVGQAGRVSRVSRVAAVASRVGTAATVAAGIGVAAVNLGETAAAIQAARSGDVQRAQQLSSSAVQRGTQFLSLGAVKPDLAKGTVTTFGVQKQASVENFRRGIGKIFGRNS